MIPALLLTTLPTPRAELEALFDRYDKLRNAEISISKSARLRKREAQEADTEIILAYADQRRFRVTVGNYWGGGGYYISDGKTLLAENADGGPAQLRKAAPLMQAHSDLALRAGNSSLIFLFLEGRASMPKLIAPGTEVRGGRNWLQFTSKGMGNMTLTTRDGWIQEIAYDNRPERMASYLMFPMWYERPDDPMQIEAFSYQFKVRFPARTFDPTPPKGVVVQDARGG